VVAMALDTPMGFNYSPRPVKIELLANSHSSQELVDAIVDGIPGAERDYDSEQLRKREKAHLVLIVQEWREAVNNDEFIDD